MRSHRNLHQLLGIENTEVSPHEHFAFGMGLGYGLTAGGSEGGGGSSGHGLYASQAPHGGKIKPINWKKVGNTLKSGLKTAGHYLVPAATSALAGAAGTFLGGPLGGVAGAAAGKYAGDQIDKAVGLGIKGSRSKTRKGRLDYMTHKGDIDYHEGGHEMVGDPYGGTLKTSLNKLWKKVPKPLHKPLEDLGKGAIKVAGYGVGKKARLVKGSQEAKDFMASIRRKKVTGKGVDNNEPHSGAIRMSPYQNF